MKNNLANAVKNAIAQTQDGKLQKGDSHYDKFILSCIDANTNPDGSIDIDSLDCDFSYMISQLQAARKPLHKLQSINQ